MTRANAQLTIRRAQARDAACLARIYNAASGATPRGPDWKPATAEERVAWLARRGPRQPVFVLERAGRIVGYSMIGAPYWRPHLRDTATTGVYVAPEAMSSLLPAKCFAHILLSAEALGYRQVVNAVLGSNRASLRGTARVMTRLGAIEAAYRRADTAEDIVFFRTTAEEIRMRRALFGRVLRGVHRLDSPTPTSRPQEPARAELEAA